MAYSSLIMGLQVLFVSIVCFLSLSQHGIEGLKWKLSKQEDLELERQLKVLNKPSIKTIYTDHGDIYDCINYYQQPAFDHPLLKNHTYNFETETTSTEILDEDSSEFIPDFGLKGEKCPIGTVIIKRLTKEDLIREKIASKMRIGENGNYAHCAGMITKVGAGKYAGAGAKIGIYNPIIVNRQQYSAARVVVTNGPFDRIAVGWRVDTLMHNDNKTHFYIRTDGREAHCFGTRCPGFVVTSRERPIEGIFKTISVKGGPRFHFQVDIVRDGDGNWKLRYGPDDKIEVGHWPKNIFSPSPGLGELASNVEWGGEVFSIPPMAKPPMGIGAFPTKDITQSSFMIKLVYRNEHVVKMDAQDLEPYVDRDDEYRVIDVPDGKSEGHMIYYGGPGGRW